MCNGSVHLFDYIFEKDCRDCSLAFEMETESEDGGKKEVKDAEEDEKEKLRVFLDEILASGSMLLLTADGKNARHKLSPLEVSTPPPQRF